MAKLTALQVKAISEPGRHGDGDGLYLNVAPPGSKSWVQESSLRAGAGTLGWVPFPQLVLPKPEEWPLPTGST